MKGSPFQNHCQLNDPVELGLSKLIQFNDPVELGLSELIQFLMGNHQANKSRKIFCITYGGKSN
uniref:Uncharacterized protein n=1 Tax=Anguilla anguilla TaxID=7936 RepID=A0A0E9WLR7_ANGAN